MSVNRNLNDKPGIEDNDALLTYRVGPVFCCGPTLPVITITSPPALTHPPGTNIAEPGIFKYGKYIVSATDLRYRFGVKQENWKQPGQVIIAKQDDQARGYFVDEIKDVIRFPSKGWGQLPVCLPRGVFSRTLLLDGQIYLYADFEKLSQLQGTGYLTEYIEQLEKAEKAKTDETKIKSKSIARSGISPAADSKSTLNKTEKRTPATEKEYPENIAHKDISQNKTSKENETTDKTSTLKSTTEKSAHINTIPETEKSSNKTTPDNENAELKTPGKSKTSNINLRKENKSETTPQEKTTPPNITSGSESELNLNKAKSESTDKPPLSRNLTINKTETKINTSRTVTENKSPEKQTLSTVSKANKKTSSKLQEKIKDKEYPSSASKTKSLESLSDQYTRKTKQKDEYQKPAAQHKEIDKSQQSSGSFKSQFIILFIVLLLAGGGYYYLADKNKKNTVVSSYSTQNQPVELTTDSLDDTSDYSQTISNESSSGYDAEQTTNISKDATEIENPDAIQNNINISLTEDKVPEKEITEQSSSDYHASIKRETDTITIELDGPLPPALKNTEKLDSSLDTKQDSNAASKETPEQPIHQEAGQSDEQNLVKQVDKKTSGNSSLKDLESNDSETKTSNTKETETEKTVTEITIETGKAQLKTNQTSNSFEIIHIVIKGDTLWAIAKHYLQNPFRYPELAKLSKIKNPDLIYPGNRVIIIYRESRQVK